MCVTDSWMHSLDSLRYTHTHTPPIINNNIEALIDTYASRSEKKKTSYLTSLGLRFRLLLLRELSMYVSRGFHAGLIRGVYIRRRQASAACALTHELAKVSPSTLALEPSRTLLKLLLFVLDDVLVLLSLPR